MTDSISLPAAQASPALALERAKRPAILFCGKHRVNFAMYHPVYRLLREDARVRPLLSTGRYRRWPLWGWRAPRDPEHLNEKLFAEFDVDPAHFHKTGGRDTRRGYEVYVSSNVDEKLMPPRCEVKVQIFQGVSFRNYAVDPKYLAFDKLFFIGRYHLEQYLDRGLLREDDPRIELIGMPKLDRLVDGTFERQRILGGFGLDPSLPTVLWAPTGAPRNGFEKWGVNGSRAIQAAGVNLILKLHDHPHLPRGVSHGQLIESAKASLGPNGRFAEHSDIAPLLAAADLLVTDASSVAFEYCLVDRPIVFIDVTEMIQSREKAMHAPMDLETHGRKIGRIVATPEGLTETIKAELSAPGELSPLRRAAAKHLFYEPGGASRRAADRLIALAGDAQSRG